MSFLVDAEMLDDYRDLTADDMGAYSPQEYVHATFEDNRVKHLACNRERFLTTEELQKVGMINAVAFILLRKYGKCKAIPRFKKNDRTTSSG